MEALAPARSIADLDAGERSPGPAAAYRYRVVQRCREIGVVKLGFMAASVAGAQFNLAKAQGNVDDMDQWDPGRKCL